MNKNFYAILMAAGSGTRMGMETPKQFLHLGDKPILRISIEKFLEACPGIKIVTVLPEAHIPYWKNYCIESNFHCPQILVSGGITRFHSVKNALAKIPNGAVVAIHDGVRPLVSSALISSMLDMMNSCRAVIPAIPSVDTLKILLKSSDGVLVESGEPAPDRSCIYGVQTPQIFRAEDIKAAYERPYDTSFTDDASVAAAIKIPLSYIPGERLNFKITTKEDLALAEAVIQSRR